ncbi:class A sortase [Sporolactobacillus shoreicorticis]|uniref:Class A sortase n=1 Tax=Sporolactobacillus shoreicorticis TaxID=1923877 RepID=A0ABW5S813_9BACL|nr:class A sortase [Sporolactobacillus shoreicorticis]MCO7125482.1 class A sortase [Sporolactobacillus shoreicorticis]
MWRKMLIIVLIAAGLFLIASPFLKESLIGFLSAKYNTDKLTATQLEKNNQRDASYDFSKIQPPTFYETVKAGVRVNSRSVIGRIQVKRVGINLPILKGTTSANLLVGATTMRPDQQMGEGNYPLAGHHMRRENLLFGPLMRAKIGDEIRITNLKKDYIYQVINKKVVSESEGNVIEQTKAKQITLVTCDKPTRTPNRLIVTGKLVRETVHR